MKMKTHRRGGEVVVAACDERLVGKTLVHGELKMHISKGFYGEESVEEEDLLAALRFCTNANLVGEETIRAAVKAGFVHKDCVILIGDVPHALIFKIPPSP